MSDYYRHRAIVHGKSVLLMRGPFRHRKTYTFTKWGARRLARRWEAKSERPTVPLKQVGWGWGYGKVKHVPFDASWPDGS